MSQVAQKPQEVDLYSPIDPDALPDDPALLKGILVQLLSMLRSETKRREEVERNLDLLLRKLSSSKTVAPSAGQKTLFDVNALLGETVKPPIPEAEPETKSKKRHAHGRRRPPPNMEQVDVVHDLPEDLKQQLGPENLISLPDVETFQYDYQAAKLRVIRHVQKKYLLRTDESSEQQPAVDAAAEPALTTGLMRVEFT